MTTPTPSVNRLRPRRSCLAVPGSNPRFLEKAQGLPADQVFLDLEDACAPLAKEGARHTIVDALNNGDWSGKTRVVRVNDWTTHWTYRDVVTVVEGAGPNLDCIMLPKVQDAQQVVALDLLLTQIEKTMGFEVGKIGIEAQIENAKGLVNIDEIAAASPRLETLIFGPADFMASINMKTLVVGQQPPGYPADAYHYILMRILMAARAHDLQAIDGPFLQIRDVDAYREVAKPRRRPGLRRQVGAAPRPGGRGQRGVLALAGGLRPRRADPRRLRLVHLGGGRQEGLRDARRRDDRRGQPQDGPRHRGQGPRGRNAAHLQVRSPGGVIMQFGRTYEEFEVGAVYKHWPGKTVTEYDDHLFCLLTMNHHPLHMDSNYAERTTDFGKNVVVGNYIYSLLLGMSVPDVSGKAIANLEVESLKHIAPTFHGDTIYGETTVLDKTPSKSKSDRGIVYVETRGFKQDGTVVCVFRRKVMVPTETYIKERGGEQPGRPTPSN